MISPDTERRLTPEEMRLRMPPPCPFCGAVEPEISPGVFGNVEHNYNLHPGLAERPRQRLTTSELMALPEIDWSMIR